MEVVFEAFVNVLGAKGKLLLEVVAVAAKPGAAKAAAYKKALQRVAELKLAPMVVGMEVALA